MEIWTTCHNVWYAATAVFKENFITLNVNIRGKKSLNSVTSASISRKPKKKKKKGKLDQSKQNEGEKENKNGE